jgi:hypothetical protein
MIGITYEVFRFAFDKQNLLFGHIIFGIGHIIPAKPYVGEPIQTRLPTVGQ